ncbi:hypothetical protein Tco_0725293 [Tanacetum coccineum]|uniref:Uncharacterized protein n=1 Tax=Tanacetum coccineum TaxID=301880 RepID=A0ABQ4YEK7_9ASTR
MNGFALHLLPQQEGNMNGWLIEDDEEEEVVEEMDEDEMELDDDGEEEGKDNVEDEAEVINLYEEVDPLNRPPPGSNKESKFAPPAIPVSSSTRAPLASNGSVHAPGPMGCNLETVHRKVGTLDRQMYNRYNTERRMKSDHSEMRQLVESLSRRFDEFQNGKIYKEMEALREELRETPSKPPTGPAFVLRSDDPYAIIRDAATTAARNDDGDDMPASKDPQPSETHGSPSDS